MFQWGMHSWYGMGPVPIATSVVSLFVIWSLVWKGMTLWVTSRRGRSGWFIFFLLVNTLGIGEIIYLSFTNGFQELGLKDKAKK